MICPDSRSDRWYAGEPRPDPALPNEEIARWRYQTAQCWGCDQRVPLVDIPAMIGTKQGLADHDEGSLLAFMAESLSTTLSTTPSSQAEAKHLDSIRNELDQ